MCNALKHVSPELFILRHRWVHTGRLPQSPEHSVLLSARRIHMCCYRSPTPYPLLQTEPGMTWRRASPRLWLVDRGLPPIRGHDVLPRLSSTCRPRDVRQSGGIRIVAVCSNFVEPGPKFGWRLPTLGEPGLNLVEPTPNWLKPPDFVCPHRRQPWESSIECRPGGSDKNGPEVRTFGRHPSHQTRIWMNIGAAGTNWCPISAPRRQIVPVAPRFVQIPSPEVDSGPNLGNPPA